MHVVWCISFFHVVFAVIVVSCIHKKMNFERDLKSADSFLEGRVVLSLVLLREWSRIEAGSVAAVKGCAFVLEQLKRLSSATAGPELECSDDLRVKEVSIVFIMCAAVD